jgi:hypothetical protein
LSFTCTVTYALKMCKNRYNCVYYNTIICILVLITCLCVLLLQMMPLRVTCPQCYIQTLTRTFMMHLATGLLMNLTISLNSKISTIHILMVSCTYFKFVYAVIILTRIFLFLYIHVNLPYHYFITTNKRTISITSLPLYVTHCYMFRHCCVILRDFYICALLNYIHY